MSGDIHSVPPSASAGLTALGMALRSTGSRLRAMTAALLLFAGFTPAPAAHAEPVTSHGVSSFGALKYPAGFAHFDYVNPDAPKGGELKTRSTFAAGTYDSLNPFIFKGEAPAEIALYVFETLMTPADDELDAVYGLLAESITYPKDRSWAEFEMRPEARFSDGSPVTADDVVFSLNILRTEGDNPYKQLYRAIQGAEALSPHRVRFTFEPGAAMRDLPMLAGSIPILSKAYWEGRTFGDSTLEPPIGSGPYRIGEVRPGSSITYELRDDYWGRDLPVNVGRWNFGSLRYEYFRDSTAAFEAFKSGEYEMHEEFFSKLWATAYDFPALEKGWVVRDVLEDGRPSGTQGYFLNTRRPALQDIRVREALGMVFDFEWSNRTLFYDLYSRTTSFFQGSPLAAKGLPSAAELALLEPLKADLPASAFDEAFVPTVTDGSGRLRRELRAAGALLDEAGWTVGPDGKRRNAAGETLKIEFLDDSPAFERITTPYVKNLTQLGIDATMRTVDRAQFLERSKNFDFDITVARLPMAATPGVGLLNLFTSTAADAPNSLNLAGIRNPAIDALVDAVIAAKTAEDHATAVSALDRALRSLHIWVPQWSKGTHSMAYWDKFGKPAIKPRFSRAVVDTWWIDPAKEAALAAARGQ